MNDNSARHIFILIAVALAMLVAASLIPWSDMTGNRLKDFNLLEDILPRPDHVAASASMITDPELRELMAEAVEAPADGNAVATDSAAADTVVWIPPVTEAPRVDGHVVVESYTGGVPLARFRAALAQAGQRLVRVAVVGDSFIEGDIFTQDLRTLLQEAYGGRGTGYMTIHSEMPGFRRSVRQSSSGWEMRNLHNIGGSDSIRILAGEYGIAGPGATTTYRGTSQAPGTAAWDRTGVLVLARDSCTVEIGTDAGTQAYELAPSHAPQWLEADGTTATATIGCPEGAVVLGTYLDGTSGVAVDCMSGRGNSGLNLRRLNPAMNSAVSYDLIILEFGINALSAEQTEYNAYRAGMEKSVERIRRIWPEADILILGIADRGAKINGAVKSLPTCNAMTEAQRELARRTGTHFYDLRAAQGGENAIVDWRARNLVNADYIHLNHAGGKVLAEEFMEGLRLSLLTTTPDYQ